MPSEPANGVSRSGILWWRNEKVRALVFQVLLICGIAGFFYYILTNLLANLATRGISTGFDFLWTQSAGFAINFSPFFDYSPTDTYGWVLLLGLLNTLLVSLLGIFLATILGFLIGIARLSRNWLVAKVAAGYIEIFRNIPLLVQILFWYTGIFLAMPSPRQSYALLDSLFLNVRGLHIPKPIFESGFLWVGVALVIAIITVLVLRRWARRRQDATGQPFPLVSTAIGLLIGLPLLTFLATGAPLSWEVPQLKGFGFRGGLTIIPELTALLVALTMYTTTFIAEIVRAGIQAVSRGQTEAAYSLGLRPNLTMRLVVVPQAMRIIIPPLTNQYLNLTKNSSLATAIGYPDLVSVFMGTTLNQTGKAIEVVAITMALYLTLSLLTSLFMNWYNRKIALVER